MAIQDDNTVLCKGDLKAYHEQILPYLGGNLMLGTNVSDYYSTDEKIVGVWVDGKPVYQKSYDFGEIEAGTVTASTGQITPSIKNALGTWKIDKITFTQGCATASNGNKIAIPYTQGANIDSFSTGVVWNASSQTIQFVNSSTYSFTDTIITVRYTKTTDASNSAVSTPGCYDINRPDLWPANKEIFFGNGLYGKRYTGNTPAFAKNSSGIIFTDTTITILSSIINYGGSVNLLNNNEVSCIRPICSTYSTTGELVSHLNLTSNPSRNIILMGKFITDYTTTACTYDVWVTYTK